MRTLLLVVVVALTLTACGYRTPLTLPPAKPGVPAAPPSTPLPKPPPTAPESAPTPAT